MPRQFSTITPLGQRMSALGYSAAEFAAVTGINSRTLTEYLAGRKILEGHHLVAAASALDCELSDLQVR